MSEYDDDDVVSDDDLVAVEEGESEDGTGAEGDDGGMAAAVIRPADQQGSAARFEHAAADGDEAALLTISGGDAGAASLDAAVLQLEVSDLLNNVRLDYDKETDVVRFITQLKKVLRSIPEQQVKGLEAAGFLRDLGFDPQELNLQFKPPTKLSVVGSFALHTMTPSSTTVDLAVEIPDDCLFKKAHLNYRYQARRALYLTAISAHLSSLDPSILGPVSVELTAVEHDPTRPALLLKFDASAAPSTSGPAAARASKRKAPAPAAYHSPQGLTIRLLPVAGPGLFIVAKLSPDRNSIRWHVKTKPAKKAPAAAAEPAAAAALATPHYNAAVLHDVVSAAHHSFLASALSPAPRLVEGVLLLKTWARQRGLLGQPDTMDGHMVTMLVAHLAQQGKVANSMTPLQIFRQALQVLAEALPKGLLMARSDPAACAALNATSPAAHPPSQACFRKHYDVVFIDFSGWVNLTANMSRSALQQVVSMSKRTLAVLQNPGDADEAFAAALLSRESPASMFDYVWRVTLPPAPAPAPATPAPAAAAGAEESQVSSVAADQVFWRQQEHKVQQVVQQALSDRAHLVRVWGRRVEAGQDPAVLREGLPRPAGAGEVLVAAHMDPTLATRLVDVGPAADDAVAAARFRAFWGSRSELRRFQDGRICEAVVWEIAPSDRHHVPDRAVTAAAALHLPPGSCVTCCSGALDPALRQQHQAGRRQPPAAAAASSFRLVEAAVDKLGKQLRALEGTALKVVGFQPISSVNRQTCPFFPVPHPLAGGPALAPSDPLPRCLEPIAVMVQLESSGRWPDDPLAFAKTKAALGLQLASALEAGYGYKTMGSEECVDVLMEGFAFRLFFHSARDEAMLSKSLGSASAVTQAPGLVLSWHHGLVSAVSGVNPAFAPAARLAKRWASCQLLSQHLPDEALELLVAAVFSGPSALPPPGSRMSGFLRFLNLLATFPWASTPLVVDPEHQISRAQRQQLLRRFSSKKEAVGGHVPALYICTPKDLESTQWTHVHPTPAALSHACAMAAKSHRLLSALVERGHASAPAPGARPPPPADELWLAAFVPPLESYDVLLLLREEALPQAHRALPGMAELLALPSSKPSPAAAAAGVWSCRQPDALTADDMQREGPPAKRARVFLRAFPELVASRGPTQLLPELLVGFDPVGLLLVALGERFGHLADFYADVHGGCRAVGVKWRPQAFLPAPLKVTAAHAMLPCQLTVACKPRAAPTCVPNIVQVLSEIKEVGQGLVEDIVTAPSCRRMA